MYGWSKKDMRYGGFILFFSVFLLAQGVCSQTHSVRAKHSSGNPQRAATRSQGQAQKPPLDARVFEKWASVESPIVSNDGKYILYTIKNQPVDGQTLVVQSTNTDWKLEISGGSNVLDSAFTQDSRLAVFTQESQLGIVKLGSKPVSYIPNVKSFKVPKKGSGEWLAYELTTPADELVVRELSTDNTMAFNVVKDYQFSDDGSALALVAETKVDGAMAQTLTWVDLSGGASTRI